MANKQKNLSRKRLIAGLIGGGFSLALYAAIFGFGKPIHLLIGLPLCALIGWAVSVMAKGLDVSQKAPRQEPDPIPETGNAYADDMIKRGQEIMKSIRDENDMIPDAQLTDNINKLDEISGRIFHAVADQPSKAPQVRRFMDYYLPTTLKMLSSYRRMDQRQVTGKNADETRAQIQEAMGVIVNAFERQLDNMYETDMLDITTDIEVLETLLRRDGLVEGIREKAAKAQQTSMDTTAAAQPVQEAVASVNPPAFTSSFSGSAATAAAPAPESENH
ncbi:MAG: 5-bromo-4-chloroindolyl phosphate hydrolysis family protein [Clostridia bacterium]|nr:5-bromo-4-chloroindolyl phosphate hydrolysis family protein [Clostridia bacterium]